MGAFSRGEFRLPACSSVEMETLVERATVRRAEDIRDAALSIRDFAAQYGLRAALCANIASKDGIRDADGSVLAADLFGWQADGERWWEDRSIALHALLPRSC